MAGSAVPRLHTLLGDHAVTRAFKSGEIRSPHVEFDFADVKVPNTAFKRVVRSDDFDLAELAIVTFLMAKAHGRPLALLPAVVVGRFQHPFLIYNPARGALTPADLAGRRVGIRSYSVTTVTWLRAVLADDYNVDPARVKWLTFEEPHVAGFRDPPGLEKAAPGKDPVAMLVEGELDAIIHPGKLPEGSGLKALIPDPDAAARAWQEKNGAIQINHMMVVREPLLKSDPVAVREAYRLMVQSKNVAGLPGPGETDMNPFGIEENRRNLEVAIDCVHRQGLIPRRFSVDELFEGTRAVLGS